VALLTLRGRNEDKVKFSAEHVKKELDKLSHGGASRPEPLTLSLSPSDGPRGTEGRTRNEFKDLMISGPAPAPLLKAENFYRHQIMLRTKAMTRLSQALAKIVTSLNLPDDVTLAVDIDPVDLG